MQYIRKAIVCDAVQYNEQSGVELLHWLTRHDLHGRVDLVNNAVDCGSHIQIMQHEDWLVYDGTWIEVCTPDDFARNYESLDAARENSINIATFRKLWISDLNDYTLDRMKGHE